MVKNVNEIERNRNELYELDYNETDTPCPMCGCDVWERTKLWGEEFNSDGITVISRECPCCNWGETTYDG